MSLICELCRNAQVEYTIDFHNEQHELDGIMACVDCTNRFKLCQQPNAIVIPADFVPQAVQDNDPRCYLCATKKDVYPAIGEKCFLCSKHGGFEDYHTAECKADQIKRAADRAAWFTSHPHACKRCVGAGLVGGGGGNYYEDGFYGEGEPCDKCTEKGLCPLCGSNTIDSETGLPIGPGEKPACAVCGWTGNRPEDTCPPDFEGCDCGSEGDDSNIPYAPTEDPIDLYNFARDDMAFDAARERGTL